MILGPFEKNHIFWAGPPRLIKIFPINTKDQIADALTKALAQNDFHHHPHHMCGA